MFTVLITGGTGLVGRYITRHLQQEGFTVIYLSRRAGVHNGITCYQWDPVKGIIDEEAVLRADYIINLAGAGIADKYWTSSRKKELYDSRILGTRLLVNTLKVLEGNHHVRKLVSASASGYYGDQGNTWLYEDHAPGNDFLARLCIDWEKEAVKAEGADVPVAILRTGVVLASDGGFVSVVNSTIRLGLGIVLGNGKNWMPWITAPDLARMYLYIMVKPELTGAFNACFETPETGRNLMHTLARVQHKRIWLPPAPGALLRLVLRDMSSVLLASQRMVPERLVKAGFKFSYQELPVALKHLFSRNGKNS